MQQFNKSLSEVKIWSDMIEWGQNSEIPGPKTNKKNLISKLKNIPETEADDQELATPILSHGIFTDWSIFSTPFLLSSDVN